MPVVRHIYESLPNIITVPAELRRRRVEVIILPLDELPETSTALSDEERRQAWQDLMRHAGAVRSGASHFADNERIDADLTRESGKDL